MSETSEFFRQEAEENFTPNSDFHFPGMDNELESFNHKGQEGSVQERCFQLLPEGQMAHKLRLIFKNGDRCTFPYAYILRTKFNIEGRLSLFTSDLEVVVEGRGLDYLEDLLFLNQVVCILEDKGTLDLNRDRVYVKEIVILNR